MITLKLYTLENALSYNKYIDWVIKLLLDLHKDQLDKSGYPYILHPLAVANHFNPGKHPFRYLAGLLHDVVEDNEYIEIKEIEYILGKRMAWTIYLLTRPKDLTYFQYIKRIIDSGNRDAMAVKLADLNHNLTRPGYLSDSLRERYVKAKRMIKAAMKGGTNS